MELLECGYGRHDVEVEVVDYAEDTGPVYEVRSPGARFCRGCGEYVCRACALDHGTDDECAAIVAAARAA